MHSMTGFGAGQAPLAGGRVVVEARSVNHRFLDLKLNLPPELTPFAVRLEEIARPRLGRGRYEIGVRLVGRPLPGPELDLHRARQTYQALCRLRDELAPQADVPWSMLASVPDLFRAPDLLASDELDAALDQALGHALGALEAMRQREGEALACTLRAHLDEARRLHADIVQQVPAVLAAYRQRLVQRVERLCHESEAQLDPGRLEMEVAILGERSDVSEELARLASHLEQFERRLGADEPVGRSLDFLLQEMMREAHTIGSKSPDAALTQQVVELKATIERLREQVQNVE